MQLFICSDFQKKGTHIIIKNNWELLHQFRKVLRAQVGYEFFLQAPNPEHRYHLGLQNYTDTEIQAAVIESISAPIKNKKVWMLIALPNKPEKLELIVQKLTEIGIDEIFLWASERSVVTSLNSNKEQRLLKIIQEAAEQSRSWKLPNLKFISDIKSLHGDWQFVVFDLPKDQEEKREPKSELPLLWVIGPEGGLTEKDYFQFPNSIQISSLGDQVLRMETAAIIWAWKLKNTLDFY